MPLSNAFLCVLLNKLVGPSHITRGLERFNYSLCLFVLLFQELLGGVLLVEDLIFRSEFLLELEGKEPD